MGVDKSLTGVLRQMRKDIDSLWNRVARTTPIAGTITLRDLTFPPPVTVAEQVDLANQQVTWWNTELGWEESYYAPAGSAGLTAKGLMSGVSAGWYPTGGGPECILQPTTQATPAQGTFVQGWAGTVQRTGGAAWFTYDQQSITCQHAGLYDLRAWTIQATGTGAPNYHIAIQNSGNTELSKHDGGVFPLQSALYTTADMGISSKFMNAGDKMLMRLWTGTGMIVHVGSGADVRGQLMARYIRPPLVSD